MALIVLKHTLELGKETRPRSGLDSAWPQGPWSRSAGRTGAHGTKPALLLRGLCSLLVC